MNRRDWFSVLAAALISSGIVRRWKRYRNQRDLDVVFAYGQARARALGLDRMSEAEAEAYVERAIDENRQEQRAKAEQPDDDNPECTAENLQRAKPAAEVLPDLIGPEASQELSQRSKREPEA